MNPIDNEEFDNDGSDMAQVKIDVCSSTAAHMNLETPDLMSYDDMQTKISEMNSKSDESEFNQKAKAMLENYNKEKEIEQKTIQEEDVKIESEEEEEEEEDTINVDELLLQDNIKTTTNKKERKKQVQNQEEIATNQPVAIIVEKPKPKQLEIFNQDPYLKNYEWKINQRLEMYNKLLGEIEANEGSIIDFGKGYLKFGLNITPENDITYREYAPGAKAISLFGDFNYWNRDQHYCQRDQFGVWSITLPNREGKPPISHNSRIKVSVVLSNGGREDRNPIWSRYLVQNKDSFLYDSVFWNPEEPYKWATESIPKPVSMRIYEAHVGMSSLDPKVSSYREFADNVLPRIKNTGYNVIQLMAIMEHAYYGSFGYHVTNFFAISSRSGTPDDVKYLIDKAHELGLYVLIDIIHSHASSNVLDGFNLFDGTDYLYFHSGPKGQHKLWESRLFNYQHWETLRFLLSNCSWYMDEYHFDGFRFDGVTSILYQNHGIHFSFSGGYNEYFGDNSDMDGGVYLMLANYLIHKKNPNAITVAEDVSGMPTLCRPIEEGGFGFDYRLNMSVPDKWIQLLKEQKDENWNMGNIAFTLTNRRYYEKHIGYAESHDQSIVGDKTISMWLFDREIYYNMGNDKPHTIVIDRGMALHKMIRFITFALGGESYLNFMGNEFGHPEWVDFPRAGNNFSHHHCRRRWDLSDNKYLRYQYLYYFDIAMNNLDSVFGILNATHRYITLMHEKDKLIAFEKGDLLFIFNFHPTQSFENYRIGTCWGSNHLIVMDSDEPRFFGKDRLKYGHAHSFPILREKWMNRANYIQLYIPSRTAMVLIAEENMHKYDFEKLTK